MCFYKTGPPRTHRIQSVEGPVLDPRAKETCLKRGQTVDPLEIKSRPPWSSLWEIFDLNEYSRSWVACHGVTGMVRPPASTRGRQLRGPRCFEGGRGQGPRPPL